PPTSQTVRKLLASRRPWKNDLHSFDMARFLWRRGVREPFFRSSKMPFRSFRTACHVGGYSLRPFSSKCEIFGQGVPGRTLGLFGPRLCLASQHAAHYTFFMATITE